MHGQYKYRPLTSSAPRPDLRAGYRWKDLFACARSRGTANWPGPRIRRVSVMEDANEKNTSDAKFR